MSPSTGRITTIVDLESLSGDDPTLPVSLFNLQKIALDSEGRVLFTTRSRVHRYDPAHRRIVTVAGTGDAVYDPMAGDGGSPLLATFGNARELAQADNGIIYVSGPGPQSDPAGSASWCGCRLCRQRLVRHIDLLE